MCYCWALQDALRVQQERKKAEEANGFLHDAHAQMDGLEQELSRLLTKMKKVATGLHLANTPNEEVSSALKLCYYLLYCYYQTLLAPLNLDFELDSFFRHYAHLLNAHTCPLTGIAVSALVCCHDFRL